MNEGHGYKVWVEQHSRSSSLLEEFRPCRASVLITMGLTDVELKGLRLVTKATTIATLKPLLEASRFSSMYAHIDPTKNKNIK
jgi:hypothetical protein